MHQRISLWLQRLFAGGRLCSLRADRRHTCRLLGACASQVRRSEKGAAEGKTGRADWAISHLQKLYRIESEIKAMNPAEKQQARQKKAGPLLDEFKVWLNKSANQV